jgi:hypothetical protein
MKSWNFLEIRAIVNTSFDVFASLQHGIYFEFGVQPLDDEIDAPALVGYVARRGDKETKNLFGQGNNSCWPAQHRSTVDAPPRQNETKASAWQSQGQ